MDSVKVVVQTAETRTDGPSAPPYEVLNKVIDEWWPTFFNESTEKLHSDISTFFSEHDNSPFPVVAHVIPPQDENDAIYFIDCLKSFKIPFIDRKIHHLQQDKMILFHPSSPPSNVPRVLSEFNCFDSNALFEQFIDKILRMMFNHGITPESSFIGIFRSLYFDKYRSFSYLINVLKQSLFTHFFEHRDVDFDRIFNVNPTDFIPQFLKTYFNTTKLPFEVRIKIRVSAMNLANSLLSKFNFQDFMFQGVVNIEKVWEGPTFSKLIQNLREMDQETIKQYLIEETHELIPMFVDAFSVTESDKPSTPPRAVRSRHSRQMAMMGIRKDADKNSPLNVLDIFFNNVFKSINQKSENIFAISEIATFDPRSTLIEMLKEDDTENDTSIAYQILEEQESKTVNVADWFNAFSAKIKSLRNDERTKKAILLSRFQVAISELEYLGFIDKRTRKPGTFRRIIHV